MRANVANCTANIMHILKKKVNHKQDTLYIYGITGCGLQSSYQRIWGTVRRDNQSGHREAN